MKITIKLAIIGLLFLYNVNVNATIYYVDASRPDDLGSGLTEALAKKNIQAASDLTNAGDIVYIKNGTYTTTGGRVLKIQQSGSAAGQITYTNFAGHAPKLQASVGTYAVISVEPGISYITINGLEIIGYGVNLTLAADTIPAKAQLNCPVVGSASTTEVPLQKYNGHGITGDSRSLAVGSHHITITNNIIHDNAAAGIGFLKCDYMTVEGNTTYNNSWYTIYGTSGISFNNFYNYDSNTSTYRNIIRNNKSYGNRMYVPFRLDCRVSDGNGIILDVPETSYNGKSLVANNICFNNGGSGIHSFSVDNVDIFNNVSYLNSASPELNSSNIYALQADNIRIINNIIVARAGKKMNGVQQSTNVVYDYNIFYGGETYELVGTNSFIQDPKFVNPSTDPSVADFRLQQSSVGVNAGDNTRTYPTDYAGTARPVGSTVDIGAYESNYTSRTPVCASTSTSVVLGTGNGIGDASPTTLYAPAETKLGTTNQKSRKAMIYPRGLLTSIPTNSTLTSLKFRRSIRISSTDAATSTQTLPANAGFRIYMRNEASDNLGASAFDWNTILPEATTPATLVFGGDAATVVGNAGGWKEFVFQTPFTYTGANVGVYIEYVQNGSSSGATDINWIYDNSSSQALYNTTTYPNQQYGFKYSATTSTLSATLSTTNERRPVATFGYCGSATTPVELFKFFASNSLNSKVSLNWATATELNNSHFDIQHSTNGNNFKTIEQVKGNGTTNVPTDYSFEHTTPSVNTNYYRLKMVDFNGDFTYSPIVAVKTDNNKNKGLTLFPNPVSHTLIVNHAEAEKGARIKIVSMMGKILMEQSLEKNAIQTHLDVSALQTGYYFAHYISNSHVFTKTFVK